MRWFAFLAATACSFQGATPGGVDAGVGSDAASDGTAVKPNAFRRTIHIAPPPDVAADVKDVAVPIRLTADAHFRANASQSGDDVMVALNGAAVPVDFEILAVANGNLLAWVIVPNVSTAGTDIELFYGADQTAPPRANPWQGLADLVWHFEAVGDTPTTIDASPSGFDGTKDANGTLAVIDGIHGAGCHNNGAQILVPGDSDLDRSAADSFTTVFWFNQRSTISPFDFAFYNGGPVDSVPGYEFAFGSDNWRASMRDTGGDEATVVFGPEDVLGDAGWHQLALVVDRGDNQARAYRNGVEIDSTSIAGIGDMRNGDRQARQGGDANPPNAFVDEMRAYPRALSADYMRLDYAIGTDPSVITVGEPVAVSYPGT